MGVKLKVNLPDAPGEAIQHHLLFRIEAGLIETVDASSMDGLHCICRRLTWSGHEFLESARDETLWQRGKSTVQSKRRPCV